MSAPQNVNKDLIKQNSQALHKHLQTQFYGVITKLTQEIDTITHLKHEVRGPLERLQIQLNMACSIYCNSQNRELKKATAAFHKTCQQAIKEYQNCPKIQDALHYNDISQETVENMFSRFNDGIQSAIYYTLHHTCLPKSEQQKLSTAYQLLGLLSNRLKQLGTPKEDLSSKDNDNPPTILPQ